VSVFIDAGDESLFLLRQEDKPQGNTWAMLAGKVQPGEELADAMVREIAEEVGLKVSASELKYFGAYYVRYPKYDYIYHIFSLSLQDRPAILLNQSEHKEYRWLKPVDALKLNLIQDEDSCVKWFYKI
jgi:8-oxo-dGTP pyrophosphatase MutT (NUDIX family)